METMKRWGRGAVWALRVLTAPFDARDVLCVAGATLLWYGLNRVYAPAAPIAVGCLLLYLAIGGRGHGRP